MEAQTPKLYLNMIIKEDEPVELVKQSIDSVKDYVDGMYITITHESDDHPRNLELTSLLEEYGAQVSYYKWIDDFSAARQFSLDQVPKGPHSYIYWQDADDVLQGAEHLPKALATAVRNKWAGVFFTYWYRVETDDTGEVKEILIEQQRERIIRNDDTYKWKGMLHETLIGQRQENFAQHLWKECIVVHHTTEERTDRSLERNIRILEAQLAREKHKDPRTLIYLAKGYYDKGLTLWQLAKDKDAVSKERDEYLDKALVLFDEYLNGKGDMASPDYIEQSGWPEERANAWQYVSQILLLRQKFSSALDAINQAIESAPSFPQYYIDKAVIFTHFKDFAKAKHWLTIATNLEMPKTTLMLSPKDMKVRALECDAHIAMNEHDLKRCAEDYRMLLEMFPGNPTYIENLTVATSLDAANKAGQSVVYLAKYLDKIGESDKIRALLNAVPTDLQKEPFYAQMLHTHVPPRMWEENEIAILCGPGFEPWSPNSIESGLGGSEEAVVYLAQALHRLGWKVTVYAHPENDEGDFDGVTYLNYYKINPQDLFNHLILWRGIGFADIKPKVRGKVILWLHDMPNVPDFTPDRLEYIDKIAVLSEYHRKQVKMYENDEYKPIPDAKFFLTGNGIPDLGITTWKGDAHRMCYVSSPDRGLIYLLKNWKLVKDAVPDAELHIYYGFDTYDYIHRNNPAKMAYKDKIMKMMQQDGITYHGRVGHKELASEVNKCGIWAYPTDFTEISCISAMKAQALGAVPVVTNFAALEETVRNGYKLDVDIQDKAGQKVYFEFLIDLLKHPKKQEEVRDLAWAQDYFSWTRVASAWDSTLRENTDYQQVLMTPEEFQQTMKKSREV